LSGADVVILPDNDQHGRSHLDAVAASLKEVGARVRVLDLPGLPPKGDVVDWAEAGGTAEQLRDLIEHDARPWAPSEGHDAEPAVMASQPEAIVGDGVERGDVAAISGNVIWLSEDTLALAFADRHATGLRYVANWGKWLAWTSTHWEYEKTLAVYDTARKICREFVQPDAKPPVLLTKGCTVAAIETLARSDRRIAATAGQWDADELLFNMTEGSAELSNGAIMPNNHMDYCTKVAGTYSAPPGTPCPLWIAFLDTAMNGDQTLTAYLQRICGYCLTGLIKEHALFFPYGTGGNGKGVFINTLRGIFGTYHTTAPIDTFTVTNSTSHPTDLAGLMGARLVTAVETEEGRLWAESKIKALTGGDEISARFMRQDFFSFTPTFKLMIAGNYKPRLRSVDEAMRRRFHLIPFAVTIAPDKRDLDLTEKLKAEWPAILRWMIEGCMIWQKTGLAPPQAVIDATNKYLESEDAIASWIADRCECKASYQDTSAKLFASWKSWAEQTYGRNRGKPKAVQRKASRPRHGAKTDRPYKGPRLRRNPRHRSETSTASRLSG